MKSTRLPDFRWIRQEAKKNSFTIDKNVLENMGYYHAKIDVNNWNAVHEWCSNNIDRDDYTWTGTVFWFRNEQHALLFSLAWGI